MVNTLSDFFNKFPSPYPFDVKKRLKEGYREKFDLLDEKPLIFPELSYKKIKIKNVLILGCGHTEGIYHSLRNPDIHFICVDISKNAIESSIKNSSSYNLTNVEFINTDLLSFNSDIKFDVIFASKVFQYLDNPLDGFLKSFSLLEKHGALIGSLPTSSMFSDINIMRQSLLDFGYSYENTE
ncbi:class I SAM-dependent methyltransferase, partial [Hyphomicrobiales bacterium]|nr:class I SAM-dependent methyltransferase [Hyphomicrobiales bacterium]